LSVLTSKIKRVSIGGVPPEDGSAPLIVFDMDIWRPVITKELQCLKLLFLLIKLLKPEQV